LEVEQQTCHGNFEVGCSGQRRPFASGPAEGRPEPCVWKTNADFWQTRFRDENGSIIVLNNNNKSLWGDCVGAHVYHGNMQVMALMPNSCATMAKCNATRAAFVRSEIPRWCWMVDDDSLVRKMKEAVG
jgi:hypothetical protein